MTRRTFTFMASIPHGPADEGCEIDTFVTVTFEPGGTLTFVKAAPVSRFEGYFADMQRQWLTDLADDWSDSPAGIAEATSAYHANYTRPKK